MKKKNLLWSNSKVAIPVAENSAFVSAGLKKSARILSENGAKKFATTGDDFVDQFGSISRYRSLRTFDEVSRDMSILWGLDPLNTVKFTLFLRTIPRKTVLLDGQVTESAQKGGELRWESIMRMFWIAQNHPKTFEQNLPLFISLGSWKDVFQMLQYDLVYNGWEGRILNWSFIGKLLVSGLSSSGSCELIKKYLPQIKAKAKCNTPEAQANTTVGKWLCSLLFGKKESSENYKKYRQLKNTGTAHQWQQLISKQKYDLIDFDKIHGRALKKLVGTKFLANHGLKDKYTKWVSDPNVAVKYTGFVHELFPASRPAEKHVQETINKQFQELINKVGENPATSFIVVRDTSGSMGGTALGLKVSANHIARSMALYFSRFLKGRFANAFLEFNDTCTMHTWKGSTPVDQFYNDCCESYGSTNFQSVIKFFGDMLRNGVSERDFPTGILCISDGEFNPAQLGKTNVETARKTLRAAGFSEEYVSNFVIVLWNIPNGYYHGANGGVAKFETFGDVKNVFYLSGMSGSIVSFLSEGKVETARDLFDAAMNQEVLNMVEIV